MITSSCWQFICFCNPLPWVFLILQSSLIYHNLPAELWLSCLVGQSQIFHEPCCTIDFSVVDHLMSLTFNKCHIINHNPLCQTFQVYLNPFHLKFPSSLLILNPGMFTSAWHVSLCVSILHPHYCAGFLHCFLSFCACQSGMYC